MVSCVCNVQRVVEVQRIETEVVGISKEGIIHPSTRFRLMWDIVLGLLIVFTVVVVPYRIGFNQVRRVVVPLGTPRPMNV